MVSTLESFLHSGTEGLEKLLEHRVESYETRHSEMENEYVRVRVRASVRVRVRVRARVRIRIGVRVRVG